MEIFQNLIAFVAFILILVAVHELGHYGAARACGVRVLRFAIGFGRPILKHTDGRGTEWVIGWMPLGGYVRMLQVDDSQFSEGEEAQTFDRTSVPRRIFIALAGPVANLLLAAVALWGVLLIGSPQPYAVTGTIEPGSIAHQAGLGEGELIVRIDGKDTPTPAKIGTSVIRRMGDRGEILLETGRLGKSEAPLRQYRLNLDNWTQEQAQEAPLGSLGIGFSGQFVVGSVIDGSAAMRVGIREFDRILAIDGQPLESVSQTINAISARPDESVLMSIDRSGEVRDVLVHIGINEDNGNGLLGVGLALQQVRFGPLEAIPAAIRETYEFSGLLFELIGKLFTREVDTSGVGGPLAIASVAGDSARMGATTFLQVLALLSINLFLINLLPFPLLDGGHVLFASIEGVIRRPLPARFQLIGSFIGMAFIALVMSIAIFNDVANLLR